MKTYKLELVIPATVITTIIIEAENSKEVIEKFKNKEYKIIEERLRDIVYDDADLEYVED
jgi:hypothetical protein